MRGSVDESEWVVFLLDAGRFALPVAHVERILPAAYITPLPGAPAAVLGAVDIAGQPIPVFSLRQRFGFPDRPLLASDHFLLASAAGRRVALVIDTPLELIECGRQNVVTAAAAEQLIAPVRGVLAREDGLVLIYDLEQLLSEAESRALDAALERSVDP